jgi:flagellar FliL protein
MAKKDPVDGDEKPGGKKKVIIALVVAILLSGGGVYYMMSKKNAPEPPPTPGEVVQLEPLHVNLADGRFLKITLALVPDAAAEHPPEGSKALDEAVSYLSLRPIADMSTPASRAHLKENLVKRIEARYEHHAVLDVYITEFVTQ